MFGNVLTSTTNQPGSSSDGVLQKNFIWQWDPNLPKTSSGTSSTAEVVQWSRSTVNRKYFEQHPFTSLPKREIKHVAYANRLFQLNILPNQPLKIAEVRVSNTERQFKLLASQWESETGMQSVLSQKVLHAAYQRIIGMGEKAIPLLLKELSREPNHWFWALRAITGENPVKPENRGRIKRMAQDWLEWGRDHGYC